MSEDLLLRFTDVGCVLGGARVLDRVSLSVAPGEKVAVIGANGSGKSILARLALGLAQPTSGRVELFGQDLARIADDDLRRARSRVGVVLQGGGLIGDLSVEDNLRLALGAVQESGAVRLQGRMDRAIVTFGLDQASNQLASELSTGERRRLELARAFIREPEFLVLDAPFAGADAATVADLELRLTRAMRRRPTGLLLITHDDALATKLDARILILSDGRIA